MASLKEQFSHLSSRLPTLTFDIEQDRLWSTSVEAQVYLNFYHINFTQQFSGLKHGFGAVEAAGFKIATHYWLPECAKGTLLVMHGYYDHVGIFNRILQFALERNLAVLAFDLPGHGLSSGEPAVIDSFDQYADVLAEVLKQSRAILPLPLHALGQSTGCAVLMNYLWRYVATQKAPDEFTTVTLCGPLVLARGWGVGKYFYGVLHHFLKRLKRGLTTSSHDQRFNDFVNNTDPLQAKYLSIKWVGAMKAWHEYFCQCTPIHKNTLLVQGTGDMTVDWRYNIPLIQRKLPKSQLALIEGAGHQLVNESDAYRQQVFEAIERYMLAMHS